MTSNRPLYIYLQRPDNGEWITIGRYLRITPEQGNFKYAPSYIQQGLPWEIDPVNLRLIPNVEFTAPRYHGLHDVLRDACPDSWGRALISKSYSIPITSFDFEFFVRSSNAERWGALAIGTSKIPNLSRMSSPKLSYFDELVTELFAVVERRPPKNDVMRKRLIASASAGGARPKFTVRDGDDYWLVKPTIESDVEDIAALEHATQTWGRKSGLHFAETRYLPHLNGRGIVLVKRFDRHKDRRWMCVSAASLLQVTHAPVTDGDLAGASYPRLAETFKTIGMPLNDRKELFGRMVFNAVIGNNDDHTRNHAITFHAEGESWSLAPAFDVVPNPADESVRDLFMQVCTGSTEISRDNLIKDYLQFGFDLEQQCSEHLNQLLENIRRSFQDVATLFPVSFRNIIENRMRESIDKLYSIKLK